LTGKSHFCLKTGAGVLQEGINLNLTLAPYNKFFTYRYHRDGSAKINWS
jgi:hypothetical protein